MQIDSQRKIPNRFLVELFDQKLSELGTASPVDLSVDIARTPFTERMELVLFSPALPLLGLLTMHLGSNLPFPVGY